LPCSLPSGYDAIDESDVCFYDAVVGAHLRVRPYYGIVTPATNECGVTASQCRRGAPMCGPARQAMIGIGTGALPIMAYRVWHGGRTRGCAHTP
jgi:hypothetical protein